MQHKGTLCSEVIFVVLQSVEIVKFMTGNLLS